VTEAWKAADHIVAARLLYPEARAALAAAFRAKRVPTRLYSGRRAALDELWREFTVAETSPALAQLAGDLAEQHGLRGYDAVHLAAALRVGADAVVTADSDLLRAADLHRLPVVDARS
jgi:predicted nucleic acid-binding protein